MALKVLLLQPTNEVQSGDRLVPPLWASVLASITPDEHEVDFLHSGFEQPTERKLAKFDVVGISVLTTMAKHAYMVGDMCKRIGVTCIMGGIHVFLFPEEAKQHCDAVMLGEAENVWPQILDDVKKKTLKPIYEGSLTEPADFPIPDLSIYKKYKFFTNKLAEIVRGCPHNCRFCGATFYSGRKYRYKQADKLVEEIRNWDSSGKIAHLTNTNLVASPKKTLEIMENIKEFNLRWWSPCSVNILDHEELFKAVADSGCMVLQFGFDSISKETLKSMNKSFNIKRDYRALIKKCHDYGIDVSGSFIFGWDTDTKDVFSETVDFVLDTDIDMPVYFPLTPFPGTDIYETYKAQGRILTEDWSQYNWNKCVYKPKNMTAEELLQGCFEAFSKSYSYPNILHRFFSRPRDIKELIMLLVISASGRFVMSFSKPYWTKPKKVAASL
jgi:radical SAM superfamily enzyme YgiQ (UPF0313 family)